MHCPNFDNINVLVVGDVMLDRYWHGDTSRISPEAPVPVIKVEKTEERVGGAANVAVNVSALGARSILVAAIGKDTFGENLAQLLKMQQVTCDFIQSDIISTIAKLRVLGRNQQLLRLDFEKYHPVEAQKVLQHLAPHMETANALVLSDYAKGMIAYPQEIIQFARQYDVKIIVDPKEKDLSVYKDAHILTPNLKEFEAAVGKCTSDQMIIEKGTNLLQALNLEALLVTRGSDGMTLIQKNTQHVIQIPAQAREVYDITGAGDTVVAVLAATLGCNGDYVVGAQLANLAAGISVGRLGTATVSRDLLEEKLEISMGFMHADYLGETDLLHELNARKKNQEKIVLTNGCFDILHPGHLQYLEEARALGDCLVVAVNDDESVARLKGNSRPINPLKDRVKSLLALKSVDYVVSFNEDTPQRLISKLLPDILVKGGDYKVDEIAGAKEVMANGGQVKILSFLDGYSTTEFIKRVTQIEKQVADEVVEESV